MTGSKTPIADQIKDRVEIDPKTGCWLWTGYVSPYGYGMIAASAKGTSRSRLAHRVSYEALVGPVPKGLQLDHLCRVRRCANPAHLEPVTALENVRRGRNAKREQTHCKRGHPLSGRNLIVSTHCKRVCRECRDACNRARLRGRHYD